MSLYVTIHVMKKLDPRSDGAERASHPYWDHPVHVALRELWESQQPIFEADVAATLDVHQTQVSKWLNGTRPLNFEAVASFEDALNVPRGTIYRAAGYAPELDSAATIRADRRLPKQLREAVAKMIEDATAD